MVAMGSFQAGGFPASCDILQDIRCQLTRIIHKRRREMSEMPVMARRPSEATGLEKGDRHLFRLSGKRLSVPLFPQDRQGRMTPPALADAVPQQKACE